MRGPGMCTTQWPAGWAGQYPRLNPTDQIFYILSFAPQNTFYLYIYNGRPIVFIGHYFVPSANGGLQNFWR